MSTLTLLIEACRSNTTTKAVPQTGDDETASTTHTDAIHGTAHGGDSSRCFGTSELVQAITKSMEAPEHTDQFITHLLSQWTGSQQQQSAASEDLLHPQRQQPSLDTTLFLLHLHKLEHKVQIQEQSIQELKHTVVEQQERVELLLNRILDSVDYSSQAQPARPPRNISATPTSTTTTQTQTQPPPQACDMQQQGDMDIKSPVGVTSNVNDNNKRDQGGVALHPSSIFSKSTRTLEQEPLEQLVHVHHDPARPTILSMLVNHQSPVRHQRQAARARGGPIKRMPPRSKIPQLSTGNKPPIGPNKQLEITWDGSVHERSSASTDMPTAQDVFTDEDASPNQMRSSIGSPHKSKNPYTKSKNRNDDGHDDDEVDVDDFHEDCYDQDTAKHDNNPTRRAVPSGRKSDFHPPSPPPKNRAVLPRIHGVMAARNSKNSKTKSLTTTSSPQTGVGVDIVPTQSNRMRMMHISCLTLDTALPSQRHIGEALQEVVDLEDCADKCGEKGVFTGTLNDKDHPEGFGTMSYASGAVYKGEWRDGQWHGNGSLQSPNGDTYEGDFVYDTRHGRGIYRYTNGDVYEGDFTEDKRHGKGAFLFHNGTRYRGDFVNGNFEGFGWYEFEEGYYEGEWKGGNYGGIGTLQYKDGSSYTGRFVDGIADGMGEERTADGVSRIGMWKDGELVSDSK